ncbi:MAG: alkaline phosphatase family protein [Actinomycetia bacterium]|nr:alkaline phosphatase family protein [Actinomycetes bacterium]
MSGRRVVSALAAILVALTGLPSLAHAAPISVPAADAQARTPIRHFVMLMQANHSFDNYFGTYPGVDAIPAGTCLPVDIDHNAPGCVEPFRLGNEPPEVLDQTPSVQRRQFNGGRMDGFVAAYRRIGRDGTTAMGYYDGADLPYYWNLADEYTLFDRFFSSSKSGARRNSLFWVAAVPTPGGTEALPPGGYGDLPTIFDRLQERGVDWKFYVENLDPAANFRTHSSATVRNPLFGFARFVDDPALAGRVVDLAQYYRDLDEGTLPAVAYVVTAAGSSEGPPSRPAIGQTLVHTMITALAVSRYWTRSAFLMTYNGWGGFYDHVAPPQVDEHGYGFRVPALLVSPYARRGFVDHVPRDYTAALRFIEDNWGLVPLGTRDAGSAGLTSAFDFAAGPRAPQLVPLTRYAPPVDDSPARRAVHLSYGGALVLAAAVAWLVGASARRAGARRAKEAS